MKKDWKAGVFSTVLLLLVCLPVQARPQTPAHFVSLAAGPSPTSSPSNPGVYNVQRAPLNADGTCGAFAQIAGGLVTPAYVDSAVTVGASYCYTFTFKYTESGQPIATESDPTTVATAGPIPATVTPPPTGPAKPASPTNLHIVQVQ